MELKFFSIDEVKEFVKQLKGTRGGKNEDAEETKTQGSAPAPIQPPAGGQATGFPGAGGFAPPAGGAAPQAGAFPAAGATGPGPEVHALVHRIASKLDASLLSGTTNANDALTWFRGQCGAEAANATLDQIKTVFLPKQSTAVLESIAKLMAA